jgi:hypothetical protein
MSRLMGVVPPSVLRIRALVAIKLPDPPDFLDHVEAHLGVGERRYEASDDCSGQADTRLEGRFLRPAGGFIIDILRFSKGPS